MVCAYTKPRFQVSVYRTICPLVIKYPCLANESQIYVVLSLGGGGDSYKWVGSHEQDGHHAYI